MATMKPIREEKKAAAGPDERGYFSRPKIMRLLHTTQELKIELQSTAMIIAPRYVTEGRANSGPPPGRQNRHPAQKHQA